MLGYTDKDLKGVFMHKFRFLQKIIVTVITGILFLSGSTPVFAMAQDINTVCKNLINNMPDYKSSEYVFKDCTYDNSNNRFVVSQTAKNYRYYYYYSKNGKLLGTISMLPSKTNENDVVFTATNPNNKVNYLFIADYYVVMSSRKVIFNPDSAVVYFPGGKSVTINTGQVGKLNSNGTFELKPNNAFGSLFVKKYNAYGK